MEGEKKTEDRAERKAPLREYAIKEYESKVEALGKENFELKMQISHLKTRTKGEGSREMEGLLKDAHATLERVSEERSSAEREKRMLEEEQRGLRGRISTVERERDEVFSDCQKLSEFIHEKTKKEEEARREIVGVKAALERMCETMQEEQGRREQAELEKDALEEKLSNAEKMCERLRGEVEGERERRREAGDAYKNLHIKARAEKTELSTYKRRAEELAEKLAVGESVVEELKTEKERLAGELYSAGMERDRHVWEVQRLTREVEAHSLQGSKEQMRRQEMEREAVEGRGKVDELARRLQAATAELARERARALSLERAVEGGNAEKNALFRALSAKRQQMQVLHAAHGKTESELKAAYGAVERLLFRASGAVARATEIEHVLGQLKSNYRRRGGGVAQEKERTRRGGLSSENAGFVKSLGLTQASSMDEVLNKVRVNDAKLKELIKAKMGEFVKIRDEIRRKDEALQSFDQNFKCAVREFRMYKEYLQKKNDEIKSLKRTQRPSYGGQAGAEETRGRRAERDFFSEVTVSRVK